MEKKKKNSSIKKKLLTTTVIVIIITIAFTTAVKTVSDLAFRNKSDELLVSQAKGSAETFVQGQTQSVNEQIVSLSDTISRTAQFAEYVYAHQDEFKPKHNKRPSEFPKDTKGVTFHWSAFTEDDIDDEDIIKEADMLSALKGEFESLSKTFPMIQSLYVATKTHINIGYDEAVLAKVGTFYSPIEAMANWYLKPMKTGKIYISDAYFDSFGRGLTVTIAAPYKVNGKYHGVIGADISLDNIKNSILNIDMSGISGYPVLLAADGQAICAKDMKIDSKKFEKLNDDEKVTYLKEIAGGLVGTGYKQIIGDFAKDKENGVYETSVNNSDMYLLYDTIKSTGWKLGIVISVDDILAPTAEIDSLIITITAISLLISIILLAGMLLYIRKFCNKFTKPILDLTNDVAKIGDGNLEYKSNISTGDEIEILSDSFENMTVSLKRYISDLTDMTAEKERIGAELNVATDIQASMLPSIFPPYPDREEFDIYATMNPAKEVGGDFYDFFMVDDKHIAIVMADVSGKGVPAALFMVIAKTLIKDHTTPNVDLGDVFTEVNNLLCESNSGGLFVTAFEGVLDLETGEFRYVNAGHETPFICKQNGEFEPYKIRSAFVLAGMEEMKYKAGSITLEPGDKVFQYTDGVTEATNKDNQLYGMGRLEKVLAENSNKSVEQLLPAVKADIDAFVGEAPQFDDITMLCLDYKKKYEQK